MITIDSQAIRTRREKIGYTLQEAARRAGFVDSKDQGVRSAWHDIESGRRKGLTADTLWRIADALGCKMEDLIIPEPATSGRR